VYLGVKYERGPSYKISSLENKPEIGKIIKKRIKAIVE